MVNIKLSRILMLYLGVVAVSVITFTMLVNDNVLENINPTRALHIPSLMLDIHHNQGNHIRDDEHVRRTCHVPKPSIQYPFCEEKFLYVKDNWELPCFAKENNIRMDNTCSILIYLSEVEKWCPRLPWRKSALKTVNAGANSKIKIRLTVDKLITKWFNDPNYRWMKNRITSMKKDWVSALLSLNKKRSLQKRTKKKIVVYLGAFAYEPWLLKGAFSGGPLGELVQWSDVITSLYLLGHDITIIKYENDLQKYIPGPNKNGCINSSTVQRFGYDLLYTDIVGAVFVIRRAGPNWSELRCKMRIVDSFGTEAEFNYIKLSRTDKKYRSGYGNLELNLRQFMTMFPHSPDNSFLGFVSGAAQRTSKKSKTYAKRNMALVYAKLDSYWKAGNRAYLDKIHEYVEIHGTFNRTLVDLRSHYIPKYVINHGVVNGTTIEKLLQQSKVFVGLGFPFEGPAPLEAVANGAAFLNPKFAVPLNRNNSGFFASKPTRRLVTSQNPYAEQFIGEPYVYTIDISNVTEVDRVMKKIMTNKLKPYLPYEYTHEGMLERISAQVEHLEFCRDSQWPPLHNLKKIEGKLGQSCKDACWEKGMLCEPSYWDILNQLISFRRANITCELVEHGNLLVAPSYDKTKTCHLQQQPLLHSCVSSSASHVRLCPCRDYIKDQVALCNKCW